MVVFRLNFKVHWRMCLGIPGKLVRWVNRDPLLAEAVIEFGAVEQTCHMACVPDAVPGDYVIVHAGIAICRLDEAAAQATLEAIDSIPRHKEESS